MKDRSSFVANMRKRKKFNRDKMKKGIYVLPNLFTTGCLFAGFYSIIASMHGRYTYAAAAILIAMVMDGLDGRMARLTNTTSKFGAEYDSLADIVAFGVAPAILAFVWALSPYGKWGWMTCFLFVTCGALRLARFNVQINIIDKGVFNGLPIPAAALVVASTVILVQHLGLEGQYNHISILFVVFFLSLLMVSSIKFYSFKDVNYFVRRPFMSFVLIVLILIIVIAEPQITIFTFAVGYALSGPVWFLIRVARRKGTPALKEEPKDIDQIAKP